MLSYEIVEVEGGFAVNSEIGHLELDGELNGRKVGTREECEQYLNVMRKWNKVIRVGAKALAKGRMYGKKN